MRYSGGKFRLRDSVEVNRPDIPTPISLGLIAVLCALWLFCFLVFIIARQLSPFGADPIPMAESILWALFGGIMPILISHSIATNHHSSRWLICMTALVIALLLALRLDIWRRSAAEQIAFSGSALAVCCFLVCWLFASRRMRAYYAAIAGRPIPPDADAGKLYFIGPEEWSLARRLEAAAPYLEGLGVLLILAAVAYALLRTGM